jgi:hypothetical protein
MRDRPARAEGADRDRRRGRRQATDRLRLPRADHELAGARDDDDRADRVGGPSDEIDRFCDAMIAIRGEIDAVARGEIAAEDSPLRNAPHTHRLLLGERWDRPYSKETAFFPDRRLSEDKFWPPVGRIDNVYGDRNLVCTCPAPEAYSDAAE